MPLTVALVNDAKVVTDAGDAKADTAKAATDADEPRILKFLAGKVKCRERLGGLLKHYYRSAA